jgi:guanyl-specific ribonuclease Sa
MATSLVATGVQFPDATIQTTAATSEFTSGTVMLFAQTSAPTGWTKNTSTGNQHALRVVTGTASSGGSVDFTTAFASQTVSGTVSVSGSAGATTLTTPQIPSHTHVAMSMNGGPFGQTRVGLTYGNNVSEATGGGGSHTHPLSISSSTFSGNAINLAVRYIDVIRATKA